jgi:hypothetical protein
LVEEGIDVLELEPPSGREREMNGVKGKRKETCHREHIISLHLLHWIDPLALVVSF